MKLFLLFFLLSQSLLAAETDQFYAWGADIPDSVGVLNDHMNVEIAKSLFHVNRKIEKFQRCSDVVDQIFNDFKGDVTFSKITLWANSDEQIIKFPDPKDLSNIQYDAQTIHRRMGLENFVVPLARTINLNGVYLGTDKLGHFVMLGRAYYKRYLKAINSGKSKNEAMILAIQFGLNNEHYTLGYDLSGVLSFADMEANFAGLKVQIDMCEGESSLLQNVNGKWIQNKKLDMANYIKPEMDESYNTSLYIGYKFRQVKPELLKYCSKKLGPSVAARFQYYQSFSKSFNANYVKNLIENDKFLQRRDAQSLESICQ